MHPSRQFLANQALHLLRLVTLSVCIMLSGCAQTSTFWSFREIFTGSLQDASQPAPGPMVPIGDVPSAVIAACREVLAAQTEPLGATWLVVASAGTVLQLPGEVSEAPVEARITYEHDNQVQIRQARIGCRLNQQGEVTQLHPISDGRSDYGVRRTEKLTP